MIRSRVDLPQPLGPDERHELALADRQVDRVEGGHGAVARSEHLSDAGRLDDDRLVRRAADPLSAAVTGVPPPAGSVRS